MWTPLLRWLRPASSRKPPRSAAPPRRAFVPRLDPLEDRTVPNFADPTAIPSVWGGSLVRVADFNNDSRPDILTANGPNLNLWVYYSAGVYAQTYHASLGAAVTDVAVGRINGDAYADLVVATGEKTVTILPGRGDGTFQSPARVGLPKGPNAATQAALNVTVGDLNGDGKADVVVGAQSATYTRNYGGGINQKLQDSQVVVLLGRGDGTFRAGGTAALDSTTPGGAPLPVPVAVGDVNGDGNADVVAASYGLWGGIPENMPPDGNYNVRLLTGDGRGNIQVGQALWTNWWDRGGGAPSLAVADLNGDGRADVVAAYPSWGYYPPSLHISLSDPATGKFSTTYYDVSVTPVAVAVGDVTGDGKPDIVLAGNGPGGVEVRPGSGDGTFQPAQTFAPGYGFTALALNDLDGDGGLDLVLLDATSAYQMPNV
jgi:hypothetical protein